MNNTVIRPDPYLHIGYVPKPRTERVFIDGAPEFLRGVRAVLCADVHLRACTPDHRLNEIIDTIDAANADLLLLGGDYGEGARNAIDSSMRCRIWFFRWAHTPCAATTIPRFRTDRTCAP